MDKIKMEQKAVKRFWSSVDRRGENECWPWTSSRTPKGYGYFSVGTKNIGAHRYSFILHKGKIPPGMCVCHIGQTGLANKLSITKYE